MNTLTLPRAENSYMYRLLDDKNISGPTRYLSGSARSQ